MMASVCPPKVSVNAKPTLVDMAMIATINVRTIFLLLSPNSSLSESVTGTGIALFSKGK